MFFCAKSIHSGLGIGVHNRRAGHPIDIDEAARKDLPQKMEGVDFVLVDEISMIGEDMLVMMSARSKQTVEGQTGYYDDDRHLHLFS